MLYESVYLLLTSCADITRLLKVTVEMYWQYTVVNQLELLCV